MLASCSGSDTRQDPPARDTQRDTRRDPLASYSGILSGIFGGIHSRAALVGHLAGSTTELLWRDTERDPLAILRDPLAGGKLLWDTQRDTRRDRLL